MNEPTVDPIAGVKTDVLTEARNAAEKLVKGNAEALTSSGNATSAAILELTKAYQEMAARNAKNLSAAIQELSAVKNPTEFIEVQQKLIKDAVQAAVSDSQAIAHLTVKVFTAAFEPIKKQIEALQKTAPTTIISESGRQPQSP